VVIVWLPFAISQAVPPLYAPPESVVPSYTRSLQPDAAPHGWGGSAACGEIERRTEDGQATRIR